MSHGLGHVERTILALVEHSRAVRQLRNFDVLDFDVFDIVDAAYPGKRLTRAKEVAARRAMHSFVRKYPQYVLVRRDWDLRFIALVPRGDRARRP